MYPGRKTSDVTEAHNSNKDGVKKTAMKLENTCMPCYDTCYRLLGGVLILCSISLEISLTLFYLNVSNFFYKYAL